jgi:tetratricopeptide (TPR) repeat protein
MKRSVIGTCFCALLLSACATDAPLQRVEKVVKVTLEQHLAEAERSAASGQKEKAIEGLRTAAEAYPSEKSPWLQMAQMEFERGSYGDAISHALEALERDPADRQGNSIVAVSGLRLSTKALADLSLQNNLGGSLKTEAQELANLLRVSLGEEILVPQAARKAPPRKPAGGAAARKAAPGQGGSSDPFSALK